MRRLIAFECEGETLVGTIDEAAGRTGLLIVSGGNEVRSGAHRGMAMLAGRLSKRGVPVFRFDRRGVGDSTGENFGFRSSTPDIAAAVCAFRAEAAIDRVVGFGNCDAATALTLFGRDAGINAFALANPWVVEDRDALPPAAAIRRRYGDRLRDPGTWGRVLRGDIDFAKAAAGLAKIARRPSPTGLADRLADGLGPIADVTGIVLATGDATAIAFADAWKGERFAGVRDKVRVTKIATASHSFAGSGDAEALERTLLSAIER